MNFTTTKQAHHEKNSTVAHTSQGLIPIIQSPTQDLVVDARQLHQFLGSKQEFAHWIKKRIKQYDFKQGEDFDLINLSSGENKGFQPAPLKKDYQLTLDMAKELAMVERSPQGKAIRRYFIAAEKELRTKRLYAQTANLTDVRKRVETQSINGRKMYQLKQLREFLGYSTNSGTSYIRKSYAGQIVVFNRVAYVSEEYVRVLMSRATTRALRAEAKAAAPLLPPAFGQLSLEGGTK
jgi:phage anti-repressor protein